jgi:hypothetical protein
LEAAGFVWSVNASHTWEEMFVVWSQAAKKGTVTKRQVEVIDGVDYSFGTWQSKQLTNKTNLSEIKIQKLEAAEQSSIRTVLPVLCIPFKITSSNR